MEKVREERREREREERREREREERREREREERRERERWSHMSHNQDSISGKDMKMNYSAILLLPNCRSSIPHTPPFDCFEGKEHSVESCGVLTEWIQRENYHPKVLSRVRWSGRSVKESSHSVSCDSV